MALKRATTVLDYPTAKGISINRINTHSLWSGGANALYLAGFSDMQIQKMGRWHGATFKEYIQEELASFLEGMSRKMIQKFHFDNVAGNSSKDSTDDLISSEYKVNATSEYVSTMVGMPPNQMMQTTTRCRQDGTSTKAHKRQTLSYLGQPY